MKNQLFTKAEMIAICGKPLNELSKNEIVKAWKNVYSKLKEMSPFDECYFKYQSMFDTIVDYYYTQFRTNVFYRRRKRI